MKQLFFFFNDTATTEIYALSLHDALPICSATGCTTWAAGRAATSRPTRATPTSSTPAARARCSRATTARTARSARSEEHTSELQSRQYLVCRLLLEKKPPILRLYSLSHQH